MSIVGGYPQNPSDILPLLTNFWRQAKREAWNDFLGEGLLGAASYGNLEGAKQLVSSRANLRWKDRDGRTPLHRAALAGHAGVVSVLLDASAAPLPVEPSCARQEWKLSKGDSYLVNNPISLVQKGKANARDNSGSSPLHLAAERGHASVVKLLLLNGAGPGDCNGKQQTPLHSAATCSSRAAADIIRLLVEAGADVMARDRAGRTPLHAAASSDGTEEAISALVRAGAKPDVMGSIGRSTPLHEACARLRPKNVQRLVDLGANERLLDADDRTAEDRIGQLVLGNSVDFNVESLIRDALAGAEKGRIWRRRRLLMLLRWRQPTLAQVVGNRQPLVAVVVGLEYDVFRTIVLYL